MSGSGSPEKRAILLLKGFKGLLTLEGESSKLSSDSISNFSITEASGVFPLKYLPLEV